MGPFIVQTGVLARNTHAQADAHCAVVKTLCLHSFSGVYQGKREEEGHGDFRHDLSRHPAVGRRPGRRGQRRWRSRGWPGRRTPWRWRRKGWTVNPDAYTSWTPSSCGLALLFAASGVAKTGMESPWRDMQSRRREIWRLCMGGFVTRTDCAWVETTPPMHRRHISQSVRADGEHLEVEAKGAG